MTGLEFLRTAMFVVAAGAGIAGLSLFLAGVGRTASPGRPSAWWQAAGTTAWRDVPGWASRGVQGFLERFVRRFFEEADRTAAFGVVFVGLVFVLLPLASLANAVSGGSPFLAVFFLAVLAGLAILNFAGETGRFAAVNGSVSFLIGVSVCLFVPAYVLRSFTDRVLNDGIGEAAFESILVAPLCYVLAYSVMLFGRTFVGYPAWLDAVLNRFLAALPITFVLTFLALAAGSAAVDPATLPKTWQMLIAAMACGSAALPLTLAIMGRGIAGDRPGAATAALAAALMAATVLSCGLLVAGHFRGTDVPHAAAVFNVLIGRTWDGAGVLLGPDFWVMHIPFVPAFLYAGWLAIAFTAKAGAIAAQHIAEPGAAARRPLTATGLLCVAAAVLVAGIALSMG